MLSLPFVSLVFLNLMFGVRIICIEHAFFTTYLQQGLNATSTKSIAPVIPTEFRLLAYFFPCLVSFFINAATLIWNTRSMGTYLLKYPQFLLAPCFTPFMFEAYKDNSNNSINHEFQLRVWKKGTLANAIYLGCLPQCDLVAMEYYKGVPSFYFDYDRDDVWWYDEQLFLHSMQYGGIHFSFLSFMLFSLLIFRMFCTDCIFKNQSKLCKPIHLICLPCPQNCFVDTSIDQSELKTHPTPASDNEVTQEGLSPKSSLQTSSNHTTDENVIDSCPPELSGRSTGEQGIENFCHL